MPSPRPDRFVESGKFGDRTAAWALDAGQSAPEVAAAWTQHRLAVRVNELIAAGTVTAAGLADAIGEKPENLRRKLTGAAQASFADILGWVLALGPHAERVLPKDAMSLLPPTHRAAAQGWVPGRFDLPVFVPPADGDPADWDWRSVVEDTHRLCRQEELAGRGTLLEEGLLRHSLLVSLGHLGLAPHRLYTRQRLAAADTEADVDIVVGPGLAAGIVLLLLRRRDPPDATAQANALSAAARRVLALGTTALQARVLIVVASREAHESFDDLTSWAPTEDKPRTGRLGLEAAVRLAGDGTPSTYAAVEISELARSVSDTGLHVVAYTVGKVNPDD